MKIRIRNKKAVIAVFAIFIAFSFIATAALLPHFAKGTTKATVLQSVVVSTEGGAPDDKWLNYNEPFTTTIDDMIHCTNYCNKRWIWNRACADAPVFFDLAWLKYPGNSSEGFEVGEFLFGETQTIELRMKNVDFGQSPWDVVENQVWATLTFNTCGKTFDWTLEYEGLHNANNYYLIYYANYPEYWTEGPVTVLGTIYTEGDLASGTASGSIEVPSMPFIMDENSQRSVNEPPINEDYDHDFGAKFWLIPDDALNGENVNWELAPLFLWETDLGFFMDCRETEPTPLPNVWPLFNLICGDVATLKSEHVYCWITCNHVALNIMPGTYKYDQILSLYEPTR